MSIRKSVSRRDFIKIAAVVGGAGIASKLGFDRFLADKTITTKETRVLMGTIINLAVVAESKSQGEQAVAATFAELERQISIFDHRADDSLVAVLNRNGTVIAPPVELVTVLHLAGRVSEKSRGGVRCDCETVARSVSESPA